MKNVTTIDLVKYNATQTELMDWAKENNISVYRVTPSNPNNLDVKTLYGFENEADIIAFSIRFGKSTMTYKPRSTIKIPRGPGTV